MVGALAGTPGSEPGIAGPKPAPRPNVRQAHATHFRPLESEHAKAGAPGFEPGIAGPKPAPRPNVRQAHATHFRPAESEHAKAGAPGFEPGIAGPKPAALPLGYAPSLGRVRLSPLALRDVA